MIWKQMRDAKKCGVTPGKPKTFSVMNSGRTTQVKLTHIPARQNDNPHDILVPRRVFDGIRTDVSDGRLGRLSDVTLALLDISGKSGKQFRGRRTFTTKAFLVVSPRR